jgi:hypothetical protein
VPEVFTIRPCVGFIGFSALTIISGTTEPLSKIRSQAPQTPCHSLLTLNSKGQ